MSFDLHQSEPKVEPTEPHIALITRKWGPAMGGMETWSMNVAEALERRIDMSVIALPGRPNGMPPSTIALMLFPFTVARRFLAMERKPTIILLGDMAIWPLGILLKLLGFKGTTLIAAHGTDVAYHRRGGFRGGLYKAYLKLGAIWGRIYRPIANSRATAEVMTETGWTAAQVIPLGTKPIGNGDSFNGTKMPRSLLFAGRLTARKGCSWFVKNVLPHLDDDVTLHIAGTGWDPTEECVLTHPQVRYLGLLDKQTLAQAYAEALCVIVPNIELANGEFEGFGLVAVEAAAAGGIVLAADHGGLRDAVIDGESGYLIESGNAEAWIEAVGRICSMPSAENSAFRTKAQNTAREYYNWSRVADEILALAETDL